MQGKLGNGKQVAKNDEKKKEGYEFGGILITKEKRKKGELSPVFFSFS